MFFSFCPLRCCRTVAALHLAAAHLVACCWTINSHLCGSFCPWRIQVLCTVCLAPLMGWQWGSSVWLVVRLLGSCTRLPHLPLPTYDPCIELIEFCIMSDHQQQQEQLFRTTAAMRAAILCTYFRILHFLFAICASLEMYKFLGAWQV